MNTLDREIEELIQNTEVPEEKKRALRRQMGLTGVRSGECRESHPVGNQGDMREGPRIGNSGIGRFGGL